MPTCYMETQITTRTLGPSPCTAICAKCTLSSKPPIKRAVRISYAWVASPRLVSEIFANQLHVNTVFEHMPFNDTPHIAKTLRRFAVHT